MDNYMYKSNRLSMAEFFDAELEIVQLGGQYTTQRPKKTYPEIFSDDGEKQIIILK